MRRRSFVPRVALLLVLAVGSGVLLAGVLLPIVGGVGLAARSTSNYFVGQNTGICTPTLPQTSKIVDGHGHTIAHFYGKQNRRLVTLKQVPQVMQDSLLAVEDVRFYADNGIDLRAALRALLANGSAGSVTQGGSTLTQQYVKNILLQCNDKTANADTLARKVREAAISLNLARTESKSDILQGYLNLVYFGDNTYGIGAAAQHYFDEPVQKLDLVQSALLAGLVQAPSAYDPHYHPNKALARRNVVLGQLLKYNFIGPHVYRRSIKKPLGLHIHTLGNECTASKYPWFCSYVAAVVTQDLGNRDLLSSGLTVHTTLLPRYEKDAEAALHQYVPARNKAHVAGAEAMVQPGTGKVLAVAVSQDYGTDSKKGQTEINYAVNGDEGGSDDGVNVGSTAKLFVLAAALKEGLPLSTAFNSPGDITLDDYEGCHGPYGSPYTLHNAGGSSESGRFNMVTGTWYSINTYYAQLEQKTGLCEPQKIARSLGMTQANGNRWRQDPSAVLGIQKFGVSPLDMATAYATIAARGNYCPAYAITSITDADGNSLPLPAHPCDQVLDPSLADTITSILQGVLTQPNATAANVGDPGRPAAGKTGTADNDAVSNFAGYVPQLASFVWVGHPTNTQRTLDQVTLNGQYYPTVFGATLAGPIWKETFEKALVGVPVESLPSQPSQIYVNGQQSAIPDVSGDSPSAASATLTQAGFAPSVSPTQVASDLPAGTVARTSPPAGTQVTPGTSVVIYVSNGRQPATSPPPKSPPANHTSKASTSPPSAPTTPSTTPATSSSPPAATSPPASKTPIPPPAGGGGHGGGGHGGGGHGGGHRGRLSKH